MRGTVSWSSPFEARRESEQPTEGEIVKEEGKKRLDEILDEVARFEEHAMEVPVDRFVLRENEQERERLRREARRLGAERFFLNRDAGYGDVEGAEVDGAFEEYVEFFSDEPRETDDVELAEAIFAEAFAEGYRARRNGPRFEVCPDRGVLEEIDCRTGGDELLRPSIGESAISRYFQLVRRTREQMRGMFSRAEEAALIDATPGYHLEPFEPERFPEHAAHTIKLYRLEEEHGIDRTALVEKLAGLSPLQLAALLDAIGEAITRGRPESFTEGIPGVDAPWPPLF